MRVTTTTFLRRAQVLIGRHLSTLIFMTVVLWAPFEALYAYLTPPGFDTAQLRFTFDLAQLIDASAGIVVTGAIITTLHATSVNRRPALHTALAGGLSAWPRLLWTNFLAGILIIVGFLLLLAPGAYIAARLLLVEPISVCERVSGVAAIRRSFNLTAGLFFSLVPILLILAGILAGSLAVVVLPPLLFSEFDSRPARAILNLAADCMVTLGIVFVFAVYEVITSMRDTAISSS